MTKNLLQTLMLFVFFAFIEKKEAINPHFVLFLYLEIMMRKLIYSLAALLLAGVCASAQDAALVDVASAYSEGRMREAFSRARALSAKDPSNDAAWYYMGMSAFSLEEEGVKTPEDAAVYMKKAIALDSANYWYRDRLATIYYLRRDKELAIAQYEDLRRDFPKKPDACYQLVNLYLLDNRTDKALEMLDEIDLMMGKSDPSVITRYRILISAQKQEEALEVLKDYSEEYSSPMVLSMLGDHQMGMYNDSLAVAYYDGALALDKDYAPALLGKAETFRMTRKYPEYFAALYRVMDNEEAGGDAKADYMMQMLRSSDPRFMKTFMAEIDSCWNIALSHHGADSAIVTGSGAWYYQTERKDKALELFKGWAGNNPSDKSARITYLQMLASCEMYPELKAEAQKAFSDFPDDVSILEFINYAGYQTKDYEGVIANCERILATTKDTDRRVGAYSTMGDMYHTLGDQNKCFAAYKKALKADPDYAPVLNNYAYFLALEGRNLGAAAKMASKAVEQEPDNATYLDTLGWILHLQGKDSEAKPLFKHAMLYGGKESSVILMHYSRVLDALGETDLAKVYRNQAQTKAAQNPEEE